MLATLEEDVGSELLPDLLATFVAETERRLGLLVCAAVAGDAAAAAHEAHALKGGAATFGALQLRDQALVMERCARQGDVPQLRDLLPRVSEQVRLACAALRARLPEP